MYKHVAQKSLPAGTTHISMRTDYIIDVGRNVWCRHASCANMLLRAVCLQEPKVSRVGLFWIYMYLYLPIFLQGKCNTHGGTELVNLTHLLTLTALSVRPPTISAILVHLLPYFWWPSKSTRSSCGWRFLWELVSIVDAIEYFTSRWSAGVSGCRPLSCKPCKPCG